MDGWVDGSGSPDYRDSATTTTPTSSAAWTSYCTTGGHWHPLILVFQCSALVLLLGHGPALDGQDRQTHARPDGQMATFVPCNATCREQNTNPGDAIYCLAGANAIPISATYACSSISRRSVWISQRCPPHTSPPSLPPHLPISRWSLASSSSSSSQITLAQHQAGASHRQESSAVLVPDCP